MIMLIDNFDSFAYNLARYLRRLGQEVEVVRNDAIDVATIRRRAPQAIVLSPGPCTPSEAGCSLEIVRRLYAEVPMLGICLGHQAIAAALGARIVRAAEPWHGRTSAVNHSGSRLFARVPSPLTACRYHSLIVDPATIPDDLCVTAQTEDDIVMALEHVAYPVVGLQFHPEAVLTEYGFRLLANFLTIAGLATSVDVEILASSERQLVATAPEVVPRQPVTF